MTVSRKSGRVAVPSEPASEVQVRDAHGNLVVLCVNLGTSILVSRAGDPDFEWVARNHGIDPSPGGADCGAGVRPPAPGSGGILFG